MNGEEKHKYFVTILLAIFCGIITFSVVARVFKIQYGHFPLASYFESMKGDDQDKDEIRTDDPKKIDPSKLVGATTVTTNLATTTQYVLMAFDGSKSIQSWENVLNFAQEMKDAGTTVHFTFFINAVYFLSYGSKDNYISPVGKVAGSAIGFSDYSKDISDRIVEVNRALKDGHEIGSHTSGHNDGSKWTLDEWAHEFDSFNYILSNIQKLNPGLVLKEALQLKTTDIVGFRAPNLGVNDNLYTLLHDRKFLYDCSQVAKPFSWPFKDTAGLWHIPLGTVKNKNGGIIIAMDYNWWVHQTGAKDILKKGTKEWDAAKAEVFDAYKNDFDAHYNGNKSPMSIGHHFSLWNDGVYWEALKDFARYACTKKNVRCVSHKEFVQAMEGQ